MSLTDITYRINELASSWEQFKSINDRRLKEIETKGYSDSSTIEQLYKINHAIDNCKERLDFIETATCRPEVNLDLSVNNKDFTDYMRKGVANGLSQKALSEDSGDSGRYLITPHIVKRIYKNVFDSSPMRQICSNQKISTETLDCIIEDEDHAEVGWSSDPKNNFIKDTGTPKIKKISITTYELYAQPQISQRLLDDAFVDVESWLIEKIVETFSTKENEAFIKGDGIFQPKGILTYDEIEKVETKKLDSDSIMMLYYSLNEYYARDASFLMNRSTLKSIRLLKSEATGDSIYGSPACLLTHLIP